MANFRLRPFFPYFGSKWNIAKYYPTPKHTSIVEPFGGSAGYSLLYPEKDVIVIEKNPKIYAIWEYLKTASKEEILGLPTEIPEKVSTLNIPEGAKNLLAMWTVKQYPTVPPLDIRWKWFLCGKYNSSFWDQNKKERIARQIDYIRHWHFICGDYTQAKDTEATWFIDPPYSVQGKRYPFQHKISDLKAFVFTRKGQVIVCEDESATWLPFRFLTTVRGFGNKQSKECVYIRDAV